MDSWCTSRSRRRAGIRWSVGDSGLLVCAAVCDLCCGCWSHDRRLNEAAKDEQAGPGLSELELVAQGLLTGLSIRAGMKCYEEIN